MQVRLDPITSSQIDEVARIENRSRPNAAAKLISRAYLEWRGATNLPPNPDLDEGACVRGRTLACFAKGRLLDSVQRFAEQDGRSLSSALSVLLKDALRARGLLPASGNDPVVTSDHADTVI